MATQVQIRRGTTAQHAAFTGAAGEVTVDTDKGTVVIHNGSTAGGFPALRENGNQNITTTGTITAGTTVTGTAFIPLMTALYTPANGLYSPSTNAVAISSNSVGRLIIDSSGNVNIKGAGVLGLSQAISFNGSAPSNSLVVDSSGRLGIGTSSPLLGSPILFASTSQSSNGAVSFANNVNSSDVNHGIINLINTATGALGNDARIMFSFRQVGSSTGLDPMASIGAVKETADNAAAIQFNTRSASATYSEKVRITSAGLVGIGTQSPAQKLEIQDGSISIGQSTNTSQTNVLVAGYGYILSGTKYGNTSIRSTYDNVSNSAQLEFYTSNGPTTSTERMRIDSSGRLLVGTSTSPSAGGQAQYAKFVVAGNTSSPTTQGILNITRGQAASSTIGVDTEIGHVNFTDSVGNEFARITCATDAAVSSASDLPGRLVFSVTGDNSATPTERMRLNRDGLLSTRTQDAGGIEVASQYGAGTAQHLYKGGHSSTGFGLYTVSFVVFTNGNVQNTNNSYGQISDAKLKENIVDASSQWADLKAIQVRNFNFKEGQTHRQIGVVAQEIEQISPGLVYETLDRDEDGNETGEITKGVNYSVLYMKAVKALQEAMERIEQLEASNADLIARVSALESA